MRVDRNPALEGICGALVFIAIAHPVTVCVFEVKVRTIGHLEFEDNVAILHDR